MLLALKQLINHPVSQPDNAPWQLFMRKKAKGRGGFRRGFARYIEEAGNANTPIDNRHEHLADFINQPRLEHGTVELAPALKHQLAQMKGAPELPQGNVQIDSLLAAKEIRNSRGLQVCEVIVAHLIRNQQNDVIPIDLACPEAQNAFRVRPDRESFCMLVRNVISTNDWRSSA